MSATTRYARAQGNVHVAYQVVGRGPRDLVFIPALVSNVEHWWGHPRIARILERLASFSRLILFDKRGTGLSDPILGASTLEERIDDVRAVMSAVGSKRAVIWGVSEGAPMAILFAATHPDLVAGLILSGGMARWTATPDYPWAMPLQNYRELREFAFEHWGEGSLLPALCPSLAQDQSMQEWWSAWERRGCSPGTFEALWRANEDIDVRAVLSAIAVPTLVAHSKEDAGVPPEGSRYLSEHIPNAKYVELPGKDHAFFGECAEALIAAIEEFVTGVRPVPEPDRVLTTLLFTDIVDSTARAAELGDQRWRDLLEAHHVAVRAELARFRGREIDTAGDGFFATFDGPARAIQCALAIREAVRRLGLEMRAGVHTGECELMATKVGGLAVMIAARVRDAAASGEVLVSSTVRDLVAGSSLRFEDRGTRSLKGVPGNWRLFAAA